MDGGNRPELGVWATTRERNFVPGFPTSAVDCLKVFSPDVACAANVAMLSKMLTFVREALAAEVEEACPDDEPTRTDLRRHGTFRVWALLASRAGAIGVQLPAEIEAFAPGMGGR